jgi:hypothetical protein
LVSNTEEVKKAGGNCVIRKFTVTDGPVSKPDQGYARRRYRQNYIPKIKYKFRTSSTKNSKLVHCIGTLGERGFQFVVVKIMTVFVTRRDSAYSYLRVVTVSPL